MERGIFFLVKERGGGGEVTYANTKLAPPLIIDLVLSIHLSFFRFSSTLRVGMKLNDGCNVDPVSSRVPCQSDPKLHLLPTYSLPKSSDR